jgi:hypothetical protein
MTGGPSWFRSPSGIDGRACGLDDTLAAMTGAPVLLHRGDVPTFSVKGYATLSGDAEQDRASIESARQFGRQMAALLLPSPRHRVPADLVVGGRCHEPLSIAGRPASRVLVPYQREPDPARRRGRVSLQPDPLLCPLQHLLTLQACYVPHDRRMHLQPRSSRLQTLCYGCACYHQAPNRAPAAHGIRGAHQCGLRLGHGRGRALARSSLCCTHPYAPLAASGDASPGSSSFGSAAGSRCGQSNGWQARHQASASVGWARSRTMSRFHGHPASILQRRCVGKTKGTQRKGCGHTTGGPIPSLPQLASGRPPIITSRA